MASEWSGPSDPWRSFAGVPWYEEALLPEAIRRRLVGQRRLLRSPLPPEECRRRLRVASAPSVRSPGPLFRESRGTGLMRRDQMMTRNGNFQPMAFVQCVPDGTGSLVLVRIALSEVIVFVSAGLGVPAIVTPIAVAITLLRGGYFDGDPAATAFVLFWAIGVGIILTAIWVNPERGDGGTLAVIQDLLDAEAIRGPWLAQN